MANFNDELPDYGFPPLNAMGDYDLGMQNGMTGDFNDSMFVDPQFWSMDMINPGQGTGPNPDLTSFDLNSVIDHKPNTQSQQYFGADLGDSITSPTTSSTSPRQKNSSSFATVKEEKGSKSKKAASTPVEEVKEQEADSLDVSAEEDKRRRNTAASARFRVKKKQREQAMEKTAKEMTDKAQALEARVKELEKENSLLKGLLTEKAGQARRKHDISSDEESPPKRSRIEQASR